MSEIISPLAEWSAVAIEAAGIAVIVVLSVRALVYATVSLARRQPSDEVFHQTRRKLGTGIMLGLELLVAADIIHTVAVELNYRTVGVLAIIVLIRTFLSFTLEVELTGRWPWQENKR